ncbi:Uncharacterized protein Fot_05554 [Forsythia ovata]|uniref:Uncharacterized protein n=1 Tax=Forsythia ovata TaxID=205694 RepID=A0ABD1WR25_9LAMI
MGTSPTGVVQRSTGGNFMNDYIYWHEKLLMNITYGAHSGDCCSAGTRSNGERFLYLPIGTENNRRGSFRSGPHRSFVSVGNFRRLDKRKAVVDGEGETTTPGRGTEDNRDVEDSQKARRGREAPFQRG